MRSRHNNSIRADHIKVIWIILPIAVQMIMREAIHSDGSAIARVRVDIALRASQRMNQVKLLVLQTVE